MPAMQSWAETWLERIALVFHRARPRREAWSPETDPSAAYRAAQAALEEAVEAVSPPRGRRLCACATNATPPKGHPSPPWKQRLGAILSLF